MEALKREYPCPDEAHTMHHLGDKGPGPVSSEERLILAVFGDGEAPSLTMDHFPTKQLKKAELSVARQAHVDRETFEKQVVRGGAGPNGAMAGVACAETAALRAMSSTFVDIGSTEITVRSVCVLDKADANDFYGHAAIGFSEAQDSIPEPRKKQIRTSIRTNLATLFGTVARLDDVLPRSSPSNPATLG